MNKILKETLSGTIVNKFLPEVYENGQYLDEENVDIIGLEVLCNDKKIKLIKPRSSDYSSLFVGDNVILNKHLIVGTYEEYIKLIYDYVYNYYSNKSNKEEILKKYQISKEEFRQTPKGIIDYEITFS